MLAQRRSRWPTIRTGLSHRQVLCRIAPVTHPLNHYFSLNKYLTLAKRYCPLQAMHWFLYIPPSLNLYSPGGVYPAYLCDERDDFWV